MKRRDTEKTVMSRQRHRPGNSRNHQGVEKVKRILPESLTRKCGPENTLILDLKPPEVGENEYLWFQTSVWAAHNRGLGT